MRPGTTYRMRINFPFNVLRIKELNVYISQNGRVVIRKAINECKLNRNRAIIELSPEETIKLNPYYRCAYIQAVGKTNLGKTFSTDIEAIKVSNTLERR